MLRLLIAACALAAAAPAFAHAPAQAAPAAAAAVTASPDYAKAEDWLCLPGRDDPCSRPLPTATLNPNDYGPVSSAAPAADPPIDCFYVYPTVSRDPGDNSDLIPGLEEKATASVQFARFGTICRTYAPMYRQATMVALGKALGGADVRATFGLAYEDVRAAWQYYLDHYNHGRPFVLIGHSQGAIMLSLLLARDVENNPAAARMLSANLVGYNVEVPEGKTVGGTFKKTPLCTAIGQTGCVVTWESFRAEAPPPVGSIFGRAAGPAMTVACTNPAGLAAGSAPLDSYWYASTSIAANRAAIAWSSTGPPPAQFLHTTGLVSARCVHQGNIGYLAITVNADPADKRTDTIPGDVVIGGQLQPGWGLHLVDMNLAMGNLIALIEAQRDSFLHRR